MKVRFVVDEVFQNGGESIGYAIYDEFSGDYIGDIYSDKWYAQDDCDVMNEEYEVSL